MTSGNSKNSIIIAVPKGRILKELLPLMGLWKVTMEDEFFNENTRKLIFSTNQEYIKIIKCRSFDVATFVSYGVADIGVCGLDVIKEFSYNNIYNLLDLNIGKCRLSIAGSKKIDYAKQNITVATKYPNLTKNYFSNRGIQTETIKLNGAIEIAANLNLCDYIVDLVSTGNTLKANNLLELESIFNVSSPMIVNKSIMVIHNDFINKFIENINQ